MKADGNARAGDPKQRILRAAMACFAAKGYAATTIADIETAAGLSPRAGGTYRHFTSKEAILRAAIEDEIVLSAEVATAIPFPPGTARRAYLEQLATAGLHALTRQRELMRVLFRDLDRFPDWFDDVADRLIQARYRELAAGLAVVAPGIDAEAVAAVLLGSLVNAKVIEAFTGRTPLDVPDHRLAAAWAALADTIVPEEGP